MQSLSKAVLRLVKVREYGSMEYGKLKKEFLHRFISKILFIDTENLSKMQIPLQVFFKDFPDRFGITYLENGFF